MAKKYDIDDDRREKVYDTDLSDAEWALIKPFMLKRLPISGAPMKTSLRDLINACLYTTDNGNKWASLPNDYPDHSLVWYHYNKWCHDGTWEELNRLLYEEVRKKGAVTPPLAQRSQTVKV